MWHGCSPANTTATSMFWGVGRERRLCHIDVPAGGALQAVGGAGRRGVMSFESPVPGLELRGHEARTPGRSTRNHQKSPEVTRRHPEPPGATRSHPEPPGNRLVRDRYVAAEGAALDR